MCDSAATPDNTIPLPQPAAQPAHPSTEVHTKGIHAAPKAAAAAGTVPQLASLTGYPGRVVGCLLGKMCGDVLGAGYEGWDADRVRASAPAGAVDFPRTERGWVRRTGASHSGEVRVRAQGAGQGGQPQSAGVRKECAKIGEGTRVQGERSAETVQVDWEREAVAVGRNFGSCRCGAHSIPASGGGTATAMFRTHLAAFTSQYGH